jgi:hypothetical protein
MPHLCRLREDVDANDYDESCNFHRVLGDDQLRHAEALSFCAWLSDYYAHFTFLELVFFAFVFGVVMHETNGLASRHPFDMIDDRQFFRFQILLRRSLRNFLRLCYSWTHP